MQKLRQETSHPAHIDGKTTAGDPIWRLLPCTVGALILLFCFPITLYGSGASTQDTCKFGSDEAFDSLVKALEQAPSCDAAVKKLHDCQWGSSADTQFAPIVVAKCEKMFLDKLSQAAMDRYADEMQLCAYEYARQEGTISMSAAAMCQVDVAADFAANPAVANQSAQRASFNCGNAQTLLEKAICSDIRLGHADIVLSRVYSRARKSVDQDGKRILAENEKHWLSGLPGKCSLSSLPLSQESLNCLRNEFELRFTWLDSCGDEDAGNCLRRLTQDEKSVSPPSGPTARASFDCEAPSTSLEIVICADAELGQADIKLAQVYHEANAALSAAEHADLVRSELHWLRYVADTCPLGAVGGIPSVLARGCVRAAFEERMQQLQTCPQKQSQERISCLNDFRLEPAGNK
ncbi:MAG TPA: lysozyme inhibitor LprI family protein [Acidobacteriaceae bacterium]